MMTVACQKCGHDQPFPVTPEKEEAAELILKALIMDLQQRCKRVDVLISEAEKLADEADIRDHVTESDKASMEAERLRGAKDGMTQALQVATQIVCDVLGVELQVATTTTATGGGNG